MGKFEMVILLKEKKLFAGFRNNIRLIFLDKSSEISEK